MNQSINKKDLGFLDYILPIICKQINAKYSIEHYSNYYKQKTGFDYTIEELRDFTVRYENTYLKKVGSDFKITTNIKTKQIIDQYGSLSKYLTHDRRKKLKKSIVATILKIIVFLGSSAALVYYIIEISALCNCK